MEMLGLVHLRRAGDVNFTNSQVKCCRREHPWVFCVCAAGGSTPGCFVCVLQEGALPGGIDAFS